MSTLIKCMVGAARLDGKIYEEVEADSHRTAGAIFTAVVASAAAAVGIGATDLSSLLSLTLASLMTWAIWVGLTYIIGTRLLADPATHATIGEVIRTTGFSAAPGVLRILGLVSWIALPLFIGVTFWMLLTFVVAVKHAMDYTSFLRAFAVCFLGWFVHAGLFFGLVMVAL